jgi:Leucine Rich repeats (2 copies)
LGLTGFVPEEIGYLSMLTSLIPHPSLTGLIPSSMGKLVELQLLDFGGNQLRGTIPTELGKMTELTSLDLEDNQLTGTIPSELSKLTSLKYLYLAENSLTGSGDSVCTIPSLEVYRADCVSEMDCSCCTNCEWDEST